MRIAVFQSLGRRRVADQLLEPVAGVSSGDQSTLRRRVRSFEEVLGLSERRAQHLARRLDRAGTTPRRAHRTMVVHARRVRSRHRLRRVASAHFAQPMIPLERALPCPETEGDILLPRDRIGQRLFDVLVRRHLEREVHEIGLVGIGEFGVAEVPEHDVVHLMEEHPAEILRLALERRDVDVEKDSAALERNPHPRHRRIVDRGHPREDGGVVRIAR